MSLRHKPYRPDPFRFRPPKIKPWLYPWYLWQNRFHLRFQFGIHKIYISPQGLARLKRIRPGNSHLLLLNHVNYCDPHILFALSYEVPFKCKWLAGIEPFDTANGIFGWFIQSVGAFSIDRGVFDRRALETAQQVLDEGQYPLVIYPEGEASYSNKILQPFYGGAAQFAVSTAEKHAASPQEVLILPIGVQYRFQQNPETVLNRALQKWVTDLATTAPGADTEIIQITLDEAQPWPNRLHAALALAVTVLANRHRVEIDPAVPHMEQLNHLRDAMLAELLREHLSDDEDIAGLTTEKLMQLKNKLRSLIARKRHAPPLAEWQPAITAAESLLHSLQNRNLNRKELTRLARLETQWIGLACPDLEVKKRLQALVKHLRQQEPFARIRAQASDADLGRWSRQLNQCRQVKMLTLLMADLERNDLSWEGIDEFLVKLEILMFSRFTYRGPKVVSVHIGEWVDVKQALSQKEGLPKKQVIENLNASLFTTMASLITAPAVDSAEMASQSPV